MQSGDGEDDEDDGGTTVTQIVPDRPLRFEITLENLEPVLGGRAVHDTMGCDADVEIECEKHAVLLRVTEPDLV